MKQTIPGWSAAVIVVVVLGGATALFMISGNRALDKAALMKARTKPSSAPMKGAAETGMPRGAVIKHEAGGAPAGNRQRPPLG